MRSFSVAKQKWQVVNLMCSDKCSLFLIRLLMHLLQYVRKQEVHTTVKGDFLKDQPDINYQIRNVVVTSFLFEKIRQSFVKVKWLAEIHVKLECSTQTYFMGLNLLDRYLAKITINRLQLHLVAVLFCVSDFF